MQQWIVVVSTDDLTEEGEVGPHGVGLCCTAAKVAKKMPLAYVCVPAGWSPRHNLFMGNGPVRRRLESFGVPSLQLITPIIKEMEYNTNGEMQTFVEMLRLYPRRKGERIHITLVVRWWHGPRARALLKARLGREHGPEATIRVVKVPSLDVLGMMKEPFAWTKNASNLLRSS